MTETETHMRIRVPDRVRDRLIELAEANQRSLNAEVVARLEESLAKADEFAELKKAVKRLDTELTEAIRHIDNLESEMRSIYPRVIGIKYDDYSTLEWKQTEE